MVKSILVVYGFKILCEISNDTSDISQKMLNPYAIKCEFCWLLFVCGIYDIFALIHNVTFKEKMVP